MLTTILQIFNNVTDGPGPENANTYTAEILIILFVAFLLGYLFRYFQSALTQKKISDLETVPQKSPSVEQKIETPKVNNSSELSRLKSDLAEANALVASLKAQPNNSATLENVKKELDLKITEAVSLKSEIASLKSELEGYIVSKTIATAPKTVIIQKDELKQIEGIGPKIQQLLYEAEITSFSTLAQTPVDRIKEILMAAGERYRIHDPTSWPQQASLAAEGKWEELKNLQKNLVSGKD